MSPRGIARCTALPPNRRRQLCTMASNTGWVSVTEPLMTRRISAVAVCRSSASRASHGTSARSRSRSPPGRQRCSPARPPLSSNAPDSLPRTTMPPMPRRCRSIGAQTPDDSPAERAAHSAGSTSGSALVEALQPVAVRGDHPPTGALVVDLNSAYAPRKLAVASHARRSAVRFAHARETTRLASLSRSPPFGSMVVEAPAASRSSSC